jgi:hypothetical protein
MAIAAPLSCPLLPALIGSNHPSLPSPSLLQHQSQKGVVPSSTSSSSSIIAPLDSSNSNKNNNVNNLYVHLKRSEIESMQTGAIQEGRLNEDQAQVLRSCALWLKALDDDDYNNGDCSNKMPSPPILLVHGVFGSGKSHAMCVILRFLVDVFNMSDDNIYGKDDYEEEDEEGEEEEDKDVVVGSGKSKNLSRGLTTFENQQQHQHRSPLRYPPRFRKAVAQGEGEEESVSSSSFHRILVASATNVAVDRILCGLRQASMGDFARVGAARKVDKVLIEHLLPRSLENESIGYTENDLRKLLQEHLSTNGSGDRQGGGRGRGEGEGGEGEVDDVEAILRRAISRMSKDGVIGKETSSNTSVSSSSSSSSSSITTITLQRKRVRQGSRRKADKYNSSSLPLHIQRLLNARIFGVTCAATNFPILSTLRFPIVFLDESSQMLESTSFLPCALFGAVKILAVGDPKQLPPILPRLPIVLSNSASATSTSVREGGGGDVYMDANQPSHLDTMFERLSASGVPTLLLRTQYRCHPVLSGLASRLFYSGRLLDGVTRSTTGPLLRLFPPLCIIDYSGWKGPGSGQALDVHGQSLPGPCLRVFGAPVVFDASTMGEKGEGGGGQSMYNDFEADLLCRCICELLDRNIKSSDIGVICLYLAQVKRVREKLAALAKQAKKESSEYGLNGGGGNGESNSVYEKAIRLSFADKVNVNTVDAFQGAERKVILVATSRTRPSSSTTSSALSSTSSDHISNPRRLCVLLTRARNHLVVVTHAASLYSQGSESSWGVILRTAAGIQGSLRSCTLNRLLEATSTSTAMTNH